MANYPTSLDVITNPTSSTFLDDSGHELDVVISRLNDIAEALEAKVGIGASTPTSNLALMGSGAGSSAWSAIPTSALVANAVTQIQSVAGSASSPTTTSGSQVDMTDMTITMTTVTGTVLLIFTGVTSNSGAGNQGFFGLDSDGSNVTLASVSSPVANYTHTIAIMRLVTGLSVASHTFKTKWSTGGGTQTMNTTERRLTAIELKR